MRIDSGTTLSPQHDDQQEHVRFVRRMVQNVFIDTDPVNQSDGLKVGYA